MKPAVEIFEVGPRDGLQNEPAFISSEDKIALTEAWRAPACCGSNAPVLSAPDGFRKWPMARRWCRG